MDHQLQTRLAQLKQKLRKDECARPFPSVSNRWWRCEERVAPLHRTVTWADIIERVKAREPYRSPWYLDCSYAWHTQLNGRSPGEPDNVVGTTTRHNSFTINREPVQDGQLGRPGRIIGQAIRCRRVQPNCQ
jgi:hypothetical protein